jgi:hypothetical protein
MLCRYERDGLAYFHLPAWSTWQKVSHPTPSRIPPCAGELYAKGHDEFTRLSGASQERLSAIEVSSSESRLSEPGDADPEGSVDVAARVADLRSMLPRRSA